MGKRDKETNTLKSFEGLAAHMRDRGIQLPEEGIAQYIESNNESSENNPSSNADIIEQLFAENPIINEGDSFVEKEAQNIINEAEEVLEDVSGMPGSEVMGGDMVEPPQIINEVSTSEAKDEGIISEQDYEERHEDLMEVINEEVKVDEKLDELIEAGAKPETIEKVQKVKSFLLGNADKIIREMSPELFSQINIEDYEVIKKVEDLFDTIKDKRKIPISLANGKGKNIKVTKTKNIKLAELVRAKKITEEEAALYREADERRSIFARQAEREGIPEETARAIYRTHTDFVNELRESKDGDYVIGERDTSLEDETSLEEPVIDENSVPLPESPLEQAEASTLIGEEVGGEVEQTVSALKETISQDSLNLEKASGDVNEKQAEKYNELIDLYDECLDKTQHVKSEVEKENFLHILSNFKKLIEKINLQKGKDALDNILIYKSHAYDLRRDLNYILESESEKIEKNTAEKNKLFDISNSLKKLIGRIGDRNERNELLASVERLENHIGEVGDENNDENSERLKRLENYANDLRKDVDLALGVKPTVLEKEKAVSDIDDIKPEIFIEDTKLPESITVETGEIVVPIPDENEKAPVPLASSEVIIPIESREKARTDLEKKLEKLRMSVVRCSELAQTIEDVDIRNRMMTGINHLVIDLNSVYDSERISDEEKSSTMYSSIKKFVEEIELAHKHANDKKINAIKETISSERLGNRSEKINSKNNEPREISNKVSSEFEKVGVGLDVLNELEGFSSLSAGQQLLMLKNYNSALLDKMHADTKREADGEWNKKSIIGKIGRVGLSLISLGTAKTFREKRKQKEVANRLLAGGSLGFENRQTLLQSLVDVAKESPQVHVDRDGDLQIEYADSEQFRNDPDAYEIIRNYNEAASRYANIPRSWFDNNTAFNGEVENTAFYSKLLGTKHSFLSGKEHSLMADAKEEYRLARESYMNLMLENMGDSSEARRDAMKELNALDERVKMNQLFISDPNAEALLQDARDASVFNQTMGEFISKRGQYMAYGSITRMAAVATVTSIAAPVGLAIVGGMSYLRGKREVRNLLKMRRASGALSERDLNEDMVYSVDLHESLNNLSFALEQAEARNDDAEVERLSGRVAHVTKQIDSGHNFERRTRKLGEFRDATFYTDRVESLVSKYEMLKHVRGQEKDAELIELKIAQTATLMRELMNNGMLRFGGKEDVSISPKNRDDSKSVVNRLSFIQALSLADATIALDKNAIEKKIESIVGERRETLDELNKKRAVEHCREAVVMGVTFAGVGYALSNLVMGFFGGHSTAEGLDSSYDNYAEAKPVKAPSIPREEASLEGDNKSVIDSIKETGKDYLEKVWAGREQEPLAEGMYRVHQGETLSRILIAHNDNLLDLSENVRENAITNFLNHLSGDQLREVGLTTPHKVIPGQEINIAKLEEYFNNTRVGGRSLVDRAIHVAEGKPGEVPFINEELSYNELYNADLAEIQAKEAIVQAAVDKAVEIPVAPLAYEDLTKFESAWPNMSVTEKIASWDDVIPKYISKHIGEENYELLASADNIDAKELANYMDAHVGELNSDSKSQMMKSVAEALKDRGITEDEGYDYNNLSLKDYVEQAYRSKMMTKGLDSIK